MIERLIRFCVRNPVIVCALALAALGLGWRAWTHKTVDAIPDISENQVIVVARWPGRSPQDVEDQVTYPLATRLASVKGVREVRSLSGFGFGQVYVVFEEPVRLLPSSRGDDFYEARTRVLEKLAGLEGALPEGVVPQLGPDATALGQIFMYTVDGPADLATLRAIQDFVVRYELQAVSGVAEVASVGGEVREYQIDLDPEALRRFDLDLEDVAAAVRRANLDVGAKTLVEGGLEAVVRGKGFITGARDVEDVVVGVASPNGFRPAGAMGSMNPSMPTAPRAGGFREGVAPETTAPEDPPRAHRPVLVRDLGTVAIGGAFRRGALADGRGERVGGIVAMRFGENPRRVIEGVRETIGRLNDPATGILPPGVRVVPFYDRTQLIEETVSTLESALGHELLITMLVVLLFLLHLRSSLIVALALPFGVLTSFALMDLLGVDSNVMSLTGIAIAIGTMVDMAIVMVENIHRRLEEEGGTREDEEIVADAAVEVGPALLTAAATTIVSFLPIFFLTDEEGKLFSPLAWTKTLALLMAALSGILVVPVLARLLLPLRLDLTSTRRRRLAGFLLPSLLALAAATLAAWTIETSLRPWAVFLLVGAVGFVAIRRLLREGLVAIDASPVSRAVRGLYGPALRRILDNKLAFSVLPLAIIAFGLLAAVGGERALRPLERVVGPQLGELRPVAALREAFPGLGQEFMPPLNEGSLLYMPSLLPHASLDQTLEVMIRQNAAIEQVPEVAKVVGKLGRAESALDPAPATMIETVVILKPRSSWRPGVFEHRIVEELMRKVHTPGVLEGAGAWLQPIETRVVMLNSGIRAPLAIKLIGAPRDAEGRSLDAADSVAALEEVAGRIRDVLSKVPGVAGPNVENLGGKPYVEVVVDREAVGRLGMTVVDVQEALVRAIGGEVVARTVEGRERFGIRIAYARELRDRVEDVGRVLVRGPGGAPVPLELVAEIRREPGPAAIRTEDGRVRLHVTFAASGSDEGSVMESALDRVASWRAEEIARGRPDPVPQGVAVEAAGRYESQQRARDRFAVLIPICLLIVFFLLYLQFRSWSLSALVFGAVPVCVAGGLALLAFFPPIHDLMYEVGLWDRPSTGPIHVTVAVIVGFIALVGIAVDDGVILATYLDQSFAKRRPETIAGVREAVLAAGLRRIRPCLMTTFTTIFALYPVLASTGRGSDVARPMALPAVGGMIAELVSLFVVPTIWCAVQERRLRREGAA